MQSCSAHNYTMFYCIKWIQTLARERSPQSKAAMHVCSHTAHTVIKMLTVNLPGQLASNIQAWSLGYVA